MSSPASMFLKVVQAFASGDLPYADFQSDLKRLLASGASPHELRDVLWRYEEIESLPAHAHAEVIRLLDEAAKSAVEAAADGVDSATEGAGKAAPPNSPLPPAETAGAAPGQPSSRDAASSTTAAAHIRALEQRIAGQDAQFAALNQAYERVRDAGSAASARVIALTAEFAELRGELEAEQFKSRSLAASKSERLGAETAQRMRAAALEADLAAARSAFATEQAKAERLEQALAQRTEVERAADARGKDMLSVQTALAARDVTVDELRRSVAKLQRELSASISSLDDRVTRDTGMAADLQAARERMASQDAAVLAARNALTAEQKKNRELERALANRASTDNAAKIGGEETAQELERQRMELRRARELLDAKDQAVVQLRQSLVEQEAAAAARQLEHRSAIEALELRARSVEAELHAARTRVDEITGELKATHDAAMMFSTQPELSDIPVTQELPATSHWHEFGPAAKAQLDMPQPGTVPVQRMEDIAADARRAAADAKLAPTVRRPSKTPNGLWRVFGVGFALVVVGAAVWSYRRHMPATDRPVAAAAHVPASPAAGAVIRDCPTCPAMTVLPAGRFKQGSARSDASTSAFEQPLHWVSIGRPFAMSTNAVTVDEFRVFATTTGRSMPGCDIYDGKWRHRLESSWQNPGFPQGGSHPVTCVSWEDATAYVAWLSKHTAHRYRLPSASEWEYAARSGSEAVVPWNADGSGACAAANVADTSAARRYPGWNAFGCDDGYVFTSPVGSFKANVFGLNDMLGNVFQWTADCWHADYTGAPVDGSARKGGDCSERELRGGSWFTTPAFVRANYRNHFGETYRGSTVGIRLARDIEP